MYKLHSYTMSFEWYRVKWQPLYHRFFSPRKQEKLTSCVSLLVKKGFKYLASSHINPLRSWRFMYWASYSSSVSSDKCSDSMVFPWKDHKYWSNMRNAAVIPLACSALCSVLSLLTTVSHAGTTWKLSPQPTRAYSYTNLSSCWFPEPLSFSFHAER